MTLVRRGNRHNLNERPLPLKSALIKVVRFEGVSGSQTLSEFKRLTRLDAARESHFQWLGRKGDFSIFGGEHQDGAHRYDGFSITVVNLKLKELVAVADAALNIDPKLTT